MAQALARFGGGEKAPSADRRNRLSFVLGEAEGDLPAPVGERFETCAFSDPRRRGRSRRARPPTADIGNTRRIAAVIVRGRVIGRAGLERMLAEAKAGFARRARRSVPLEGKAG